MRHSGDSAVGCGVGDATRRTSVADINRGVQPRTVATSLVAGVPTKPERTKAHDWAAPAHGSGGAQCPHLPNCNRTRVLPAAGSSSPPYSADLARHVGRAHGRGHRGGRAAGGGAAAGRGAAAAPDWIIELGIGVGARPIEVHVGGCYAAGKRHRAITRERALAALADGIQACIHCRPDTELGVL
ncbi:DUF6233 domain-containing protein [Streptomyces sp. NPDC056661]|uniref:DUF6233 domain-containing protein n=1 Tax=Streptomyces sp. NPDC056661 TaxID=3345898 RepID=UPI0036CF1E65